VAASAQQPQQLDEVAALAEQRFSFVERCSASSRRCCSQCSLPSPASSRPPLKVSLNRVRALGGAA
jgi:hypothetical protein